MADLLALTLMTTQPQQAAHALESLDPAPIAAFFNDLPARTVAKVLVQMTPTKQAECIKAMTEERVIRLLPLLPISLCGQLLQQFDKPRRKILLQALPLSVSVALKVVQGYPEGTVGAVMDPFSPTLPAGIAVDDALKRLRKLTQVVPHQVFVTDPERHLLGRVSTSDLLLAARKSHVDDLIQQHGPLFTDHDPLDSLLDHPAWINETLIPVVDRKGQFLGALSQSRLALALQGKGVLPDAGKPVAAGNGFVDLADFLWSLLGSLLESSSKGKKPASESPREH